MGGGPGISLSSSNNNTLNRNNVKSNGEIGIVLVSSSNNTLSDNDASNNGGGIYLGSSNNNVLNDNTANSNTGSCDDCGDDRQFGISLSSSYNNTLSGNDAHNNVVGISLSSSYNNTLNSNNVKSNDEIGIILGSSSNNTLIGNNANSNRYYGISLSDSTNNMFIGNNASSNNDSGIYLGISSNNTLLGNIVSNNKFGISLDSSINNTLIGNNARNNGNALFLFSSNNNTLSNNSVNSNSQGILLNSSNFNNITGNNISNSATFGLRVYETSKNNTISKNTVTNSRYGIFLSYVFNTTAYNNIMENNSFNFGVGGNLLSHLEGNNIDTTNLANGRPIYYVKYGKNTTYDGSTKASSFYCILCNNVTVRDLEMSNMDRGVYLWETSNSRIQNIRVLESGWGIYMILSPNNTIQDSKFSTYNIHHYSETGVSLSSSDNNTFENNTFISNNYGIELFSSSKNTIYNNYFNNINNFIFKGTIYENTWNVTKNPGKNIIGGSYLGGNFWANSTGKGFSQTCTDTNNDGLCDLKYTINSNNSDYLALKYQAVPPRITVVSPNGGENWTRGTTQTINWTSTGSTGAYVKIELLKPNKPNQLIVSATLNDGSYPWLIPVAQEPRSDYKVKITSTTNAAYSGTSEDFTIPVPTITVLSPSGTDIWTRGTTKTIKWNSTGSPGAYVKIELLIPNKPNLLIISSTPNDGSHPWLIPVAQEPRSDYKVKITSTINASVNDTSDKNFTIPTPSFTVVSPNGTESWIRGTTQTIRWNSTENPKGYVKIELLKPNKPNQLIVSATLNDGSHPWLIPVAQEPRSDYKVKITSTINVSINDTSDKNFTIPVPSFTVVSPNSTDSWIRGTTQTIRWNSTENPKGYVKIELLKPNKPNQLIVSATLNDGSHPWLILPAQVPGTDYKVKITSTANVSINGISDNSFTIPIPSITVVTPNDGESWIRGTTKTINWTSTENPRSYVRIELLKGGLFNRLIVASTLNDGSHPWLIPGIQVSGTDYQVRITSATNISIKDSSDNNFTIPAPSITVAIPNGGENWRRGITQTIKWTSTESPGTYVKIELLKAGIFNRLIVASTINDGSHPWFIPATQLLGSDYKIRINSTINPAITDSGDNNFNINS